jgi:hypothetical protein
VLQEKEKPQNTFFTYHGQTYSFFPNEFSSVRDAVTLHAIGSYHDPITCQVTAETDRRMIRYWPLWALTGLVRAQHGQHRFLFFRTASRPLWSNPIMIRPHAKHHCQIWVCDRDLQLRRPWWCSKRVHKVRSGFTQNSIFLKTNSKKQLK